MSNYLKNSASPYLLQHAENPVNWYPWCEEAFSRARTEDKPIFLSIGYSTCHWCHVMAHESFEHQEIAEILNQHFISVKVDREERPDIDSVYMSVCQVMTGGNGGWPMSIFMTWEKKPFFAGTYFPVHSRYGMPGFLELLREISQKWNTHRNQLLKSADFITTLVKQEENLSQTTDEKRNLIEDAIKQFSGSFDKVYGGFGSAPKFPSAHNLLFLLLYAKQNEDSNILQMTEKTLLQMRKGGIFDQIGYGFSRYSTDRYFLVPHFEKMLYDNALLIMAYTATYSMTNNPVYLDTAEKTAEYILREMTSPEGGFYSAQDADSEDTEGKFYTFDYEEILNVLGEEQGRKFAECFDITPDGNFEGKNILNLLKSNHLHHSFDRELKLLYDYRKKRAFLHLDHKILLSWNALMIIAFSMLFRVSHQESYLEAAKKAQKFIEMHLCDKNQLCHCWCNGQHSEKAFLDDYAFYLAALLELYHSTLSSDYLDTAEKLCTETVRKFADHQNNGFYLCEPDHHALFFDPKETTDGAIPSGNSVMTYDLVRLYQITEQEKYRELAEKQITFMSVQAQHNPAGYSLFLLSVLLYENPPQHITVVLKHDGDLFALKNQLPFFSTIAIVPESKAYPCINDKITFYICRDHQCFPPTNELIG